jgi:hypothetical protein
LRCRPRAMTWPSWTSSPGFTYHWSKVSFSMSAPECGHAEIAEISEIAGTAHVVPVTPRAAATTRSTDGIAACPRWRG